MAFTRFTKNVLNVSALPDRVQNQAQTLKATFDQAGVDIKTALNALIAELEASTSADNIGADVQSVATKTVQAILTAFEEEIANRYTKTEAETLLAEGTNSLVANVDVNLTTGIITITKKDGTVETFDTAIEKVPAKFEIVQNGDAYALKITNVDGTSTQADITNFMNIYNFSNSDNVTFEVTGTGTEKTVTANIKANSIGLDKLSLTVVSTLEGYMNSAKDSANAAKISEQNALEAQTKAAESAEDAEYWAKIAQENGGSGGGGITELPIATADTLGGIKVGEGLSITEDGVLSTLVGGNGYRITSLLPSEAIKASTTYALNDNIHNYDEIVVCTFVSVNNNKANRQILNIPTINIVGGIADEYSIHVDSNPSDTGNPYWYTVRFTFSEDGNSLSLGIVKKGSKWNPNDVGIEKVYGIKYDVKVLDGAVDIDDTPIEGSENVITSGGVFEAIDSLPYKVLEASTDNVIDFNTLTEPGVYLIKNCCDGVTTLNGAYKIESNRLEVILEVRRVYRATGELVAIFQVGKITGDIGIADYKRVYHQSSGSWSNWDSYLTVKSTDVDTSKVRNIKASTTDLTAGTSTLTTGDIYLVYE